MSTSMAAQRWWRTLGDEATIPPLGLLTRRMRNDRYIPAPSRLTRLAMRTQLVTAQRLGERRVPTGIEPGHLIQQRRGPHVRIISQPNPAVLHER